jgi:hypothetical protein
MHNISFENLKAKLKSNKTRAAEARAALIQRVARMNTNELRRLSPSVFRRLGPAGFAKVAELSAVFAGAEAASARNVGAAPLSRGRSSTKLAGKLKNIWLESLLLRIIKPVLFGLALSVGLTTSWPRALEFVSRTTGGAGGPTQKNCSRLDRWATNCIYVTKSSELTLAEAALDLRMSLSSLADDNPTLARDRPLAAGTKIRVARKLPSIL